MKRYLVFYCEQYYPNGGWFDYRDSYADLDAAIEHAKTYSTEHGESHVIDIIDGKIVFLHTKYHDRWWANLIAEGKAK